MTYNLNEKEIRADDKINVFRNLLRTKDSKGVYLLKEILVCKGLAKYITSPEKEKQNTRNGLQKIAKYWGLHFYHVQNFSMSLYRRHFVYFAYSSFHLKPTKKRGESIHWSRMKGSRIIFKLTSFVWCYNVQS